MTEEVWVPIKGFEGIYEVSNKGNIRSLNYRHKKGYLHIMKQETTKCGYKRICLWENKSGKSYYVHRLVWAAFNKDIPAGMQINHINEDKTDNRLENLCLMTPTENLNYGTRSCKAALSKSKAVLQYSLSGELIKKWVSIKTIEQEYGYWHGAISRACRKNGTSYGYIWRYAE